MVNVVSLYERIMSSSKKKGFSLLKIFMYEVDAIGNPYRIYKKLMLQTDRSEAICYLRDLINEENIVVIGDDNLLPIGDDNILILA